NLFSKIRINNKKYKFYALKKEEYYSSSYILSSSSASSSSSSISSCSYSKNEKIDDPYLLSLEKNSRCSSFVCGACSTTNIPSSSSNSFSKTVCMIFSNCSCVKS